MEENNSVAPDERSNEELDSLVDSTNTARNSERPMTQEPTKDSGGSNHSKDEYEFVHNGKPVKGTRDQVLKWAQMGYDRPQFTQKFNQEKAKWDQEKAQFDQLRQKYSPYEQIDQWATQNPTQWQQLESLWKQSVGNPHAGFQQNQFTHQNGQTPQEIQPYLSKIQNLEQQLSQLVPTVQEWQKERVTNKQKEEDTKLEHEVQSIREQHKDLDWATIDESGKSLEMRVLEHAQATGIPSFRAALRDLLHDDLMSRAQAQAKQSVAKGIQTRTKLGVLGESPTPQKGREFNTRDIRNTSYEELEREIRDELRRGAS